jgi:hypothetical protein
MPKLTLEEFAEEFKLLLREAEDSGLDYEEFCAVAEHILSTSWAEKEDKP